VNFLQKKSKFERAKNPDEKAKNPDEKAKKKKVVFLGDPECMLYPPNVFHLGI